MLHNAENLKKRPFKLIRHFHKPKSASGYPLIEFENFRKKSHIAEKTPREPFGLVSTFESTQKLLFSASMEPTISCFSDN